MNQSINEPIPLESQRVGMPVGQDTNELFVEEVGVGADVLGNSLVVHLAAPIDVFLQELVDVALVTALHDRLLVVELDLRDEQLGKPSSLFPALVSLQRRERAAQAASSGRGTGTAGGGRFGRSRRSRGQGGRNGVRRDARDPDGSPRLHGGRKVEAG